MAGVDVESGRGRGRRRAVDSEINMVPMIDFLMVTISFLLLTAVWTRMARLEGTANVPGPDTTKAKVEDHARVHVEVRPDGAPLELTLRSGSQILERRSVARADVRQLGARVEELRRAHGAEHVVVMHVGNALPYRDMISVMDAISAERDNRISLAMK